MSYRVAPTLLDLAEEPLNLLLLSAQQGTWPDFAAGSSPSRITQSRLRNRFNYFGQVRDDGIRLRLASIVRSGRPIDPNALHPECAHRCRFAAPFGYVDYPAGMLADQLDGSVKNIGFGLVGSGLLGSHQHVKFYGKLLNRLREQLIVDIGNDGQSVTASEPS